MITSKIVNKVEYEEKISYPCLRESEASVSLFTSKKKAIVIHRFMAGMAGTAAIGTVFECVYPETFKPFTGIVELKNE